MIRALLLALCLALAGCGGHAGGDPSPVPPAPAPTFDFRPFLAAAAASARLDYGGYQLLGNFLLADGSAVASWLYAPFTAYDPAAEAGCPGSPCRGDGGEHYVIDPDGTLRIDSTQDGGTHGIQYFTGRDCGGTGWVIAKADIDATWRSVLARLDDRPAPVPCSAGSFAFTRYSLQPVMLPNVGTRRAIVSEHYNGLTSETASNMERLFFVEGLGRTVWQAWGPSPPTVDLSQRCPDFGWNMPPIADWRLEDCRENVNPQSTALAGRDFWIPP